MKEHSIKVSTDGKRVIKGDSNIKSISEMKCKPLLNHVICHKLIKIGYIVRNLEHFEKQNSDTYIANGGRHI